MAEFQEGILCKLPHEILEVIFSFLDGRSIGRAHIVCRQWNNILRSMSIRSPLWFNCCKSEIPKYTLLHLCNHPIEVHHRAGVEWRDIYVRWCTWRGRRFCDDHAQLTVKYQVQKIPGGIYHPEYWSPDNICFTDDLVFALQGNCLTVYDMHSDASMRARIENDLPEDHISTLPKTLGIRLPVDKRGKTDFQIAVETTPLVVGNHSTVYVYVGLKRVCSVSSTVPCYNGLPNCTWYDTLLVGHDEGSLSVCRLKVDTAAETKKYDLREEVRFHHPRFSGCLFREASVIGDRIVTLDEYALTLWTADSGEILSISTTELECLDEQDEVEEQDVALSWVGSIIATAHHLVYCCVVLLHKLNEECTDITKVWRIQHGITPQLIRLLYDDSLWVVSDTQTELLMKTGNEGASCLLDPGGGTANEKGASSSASSSSQEKDEYRENLSHLLGIREDSPLWQNYGGSARPESRAEQQDLKENPAAGDDGSGILEDDADYEDMPRLSVRNTSLPTEQVFLMHRGTKQTDWKPLPVRIPHQGCHIYTDVRHVVFTDTGIAVVSNCNHPCRDMFTLFEWSTAD